MFQSLYEVSGFPLIEDLRISILMQRWKNELDDLSRVAVLRLLETKLERRDIVPDARGLAVVKRSRNGCRTIKYNGGFFTITIMVTPHRSTPLLEVVEVDHVSTEFGLVARVGERWEVPLQ